MASQASTGTVQHVQSRHKPYPRIFHMKTVPSNPLEICVVDLRRRVPVCYANVSPEGKPEMRIDRCISRPHAVYRAPPIEDNERTRSLLISEVFFDQSRGTINLEFDASTISLQSTGHLTRSFTFEGPVGPLTWQHDGVFSKDLQLLTARKKRAAVIRDADLDSSKIMQLVIIAGELAPRAWLELVVCTSLAVLEWRRRIGCVGGLGITDAKRMTRKVASTVAGFPGTTRQFLVRKTRRKTEEETGESETATVGTGNETRRITRHGSGDEQEKTGEETGEGARAGANAGICSEPNAPSPTN